MGTRLVELLDDSHTDTGDLTITVGIGPRIVAMVDADLPGGTALPRLVVLRRLVMNVAEFTTLSTEAQQALVGRRRADGAPLSGGSMFDDVSLTAKAPAGDYLTPAGSHVRAAHPAATGSSTMLRRGYSFAEGDEMGLMFASFQKDLRTFVATQQRMDESDDMMALVTATASASFLVLPGFGDDRPLGSTLMS